MFGRFTAASMGPSPGSSSAAHKPAAPAAAAAPPAATVGSASAPFAKLSLMELRETHGERYAEAVGSTPTHVLDVLHHVYDDFLELSRGHRCLVGQLVCTESERKLFDETKSSACFGELRPGAVTKLLDKYLAAHPKAGFIVDLGMGLGKLALQAFLQYPQLKRVVGVEMMPRRTQMAFDALIKLRQWSSDRRQKGPLQGLSSSSPPPRYEVVLGQGAGGIGQQQLAKVVLKQPKRRVRGKKSKTSALPVTSGMQTRAKKRLIESLLASGKSRVDEDGDTDMTPAASTTSRVTTDTKEAKPADKSADESADPSSCSSRSISFHQGNLLQMTTEAAEADLVICEIYVPPELEKDLCLFLRGLKPGAVLLTYTDMGALYDKHNIESPLRAPKFHNKSSPCIALDATWGDRHLFGLYERV